VVGPEPSADGAGDRAAGERREVTLFTRNASLIALQAQLAQTLAALPTPLIHVAARSPYDAGIVPNVAATLLTYGDPIARVAGAGDGRIRHKRNNIGGTADATATNR